MNPIPNHFHFVFGLRKQTEPFSVAHFLCLESCRQVNHPKRIFFYYHHEPYGPYWDAIRPILTLEKVSLNPMVDQFRYNDSAINAFRYAHHSDFIRLEKIVERGGVYADMDTLFVNPLPSALFEKQFVMGSEASVFDSNIRQCVPSLCNAFLMSAPASEFGSIWLSRMTSEFDGTWSNHSTLLPQRLANEFPDAIHVEPEKSFFHFPASRLGLAALLENQTICPPELYSIHLWAHLWWSESRYDFSPVNGSDITEAWVRKQPVTYALEARKFLPTSPIATSKPSWTSRVASSSKKAANRIKLEARTAIGLTVYPMLKPFFPALGKRLALARGHRAFKAAQRRFTLRNAMEETILRSVVQWDEYGVFEMRFEAEDLVIDIGCHIGSFSFACHWQGSRNIHAFEAHPGNFDRAQKHLSGLRGINLAQAAVFRSDIDSTYELLHSGAAASNTGGGGVIFGKNHFEASGHSHVKPQVNEIVAPVISLDEILTPLQRIRLLKLDCEGSEYPILLTSKLLHKVDRIIGEYHTIPEASMPLLVPEARIPGHTSYGPETLRAVLEQAGFNVTMTSGSGQGLFDARRP